MAKWERMWDGLDNQEVGLEAAILERKRNSSLVEQLSCAENVPGLKPCTEAAGFSASWTGSGAFRRPVKVAREGRWRYRKCRC
jgi:hypothetical protein